MHDVSSDLVKHRKWSWCKIDSRNGKSVMNFITFPIVRPLSDFRAARTFENFKRLVYWFAIQQVFSIQILLIFLTLQSLFYHWLQRQWLQIWQSYKFHCALSISGIYFVPRPFFDWHGHVTQSCKEPWFHTKYND